MVKYWKYRYRKYDRGWAKGSILVCVWRKRHINPLILSACQYQSIELIYPYLNITFEDFLSAYKIAKSH